MEHSGTFSGTFFGIIRNRRFLGITQPPFCALHPKVVTVSGIPRILWDNEIIYEIWKCYGFSQFGVEKHV